MSEASRLPLYLMIGLSVLLHGLFLTGLPNLPWFTGPPDIFRLTRYVVRFAKPVPTVVQTMTQVEVAEPVRAKPAPVEPVAERHTPKPIQRVEARPERVVERQVAPVLVKPVVPEPLELKKPRTVSRREQAVERAPRAPTARKVISRVAAVVPQTAAPVLPRATAASQPRQPTSPAALQALVEQEQLLAAQEEDAVRAYLGLVFEKLERHKRYPRVAERRGLDGRVVLRFTVRWDGEVLNPEVVEVAGHESFRKAALQALSRVGLLPNFPDEIRRRELPVEVPITYRLDDK
ncbi:MAG: TonB family protein [Candidatus Tectomicrobia bacterium]|nr:TonB family protein [Candidatus Tectomicrobia bacterium]